jgi:sulfonate transport system permease protein
VSQDKQVYTRYKWFMGFLVPILILVVWQWWTSINRAVSIVIPPPSRVVGTLYDLLGKGELFSHIGITLYRLLAGFLIGGAVATILGIMTGYFQTVRVLIDPLLQGLRSIPSMAWVPLFILWFGIYETSKITLIAVGVLFPVYLNLMTGIQQVDRKLIEMGKVYGLNGISLIRHIYLPATLPAYLVGLRGGLGLGWMFVVAAEIMGATKGLGFLMIQGEMTGRPEVIIASIILFAMLGKMTDAFLIWLERRVLQWKNV